MNIGDKVYVINWGKRYQGIPSGIIFTWNTEIPSYHSTDFHWKIISEPKLTQAGTPYKNGDRNILERIPLYKNYKYTILETQQHHKDPTKTICLIKSDEGCIVEIGIEGLNKLTPEQFKNKEFNSLMEANLNKWKITDNLKLFPKELIKNLYDIEQRICFGSEFPNSKGIITYPYISKEYTINKIDICLGSSCLYNGEGCNLTDKETITWNDLSKRFSENEFN